MPYATPEDYAVYDPTFEVEDEEALQMQLTVAERDIDAALGARARDWTTGSKVDITQLAPYQVGLLAEATCAQAEYRMIKGDEFFATFRPDQQSTREGGFSGQEPYLGPKAQIALSQSGLYRLTTGPHTQANLYLVPNQTTGEL